MFLLPHCFTSLLPRFPPLLDPCLDLGFVALVARVVEAAVFVDVGQILLRDPVAFVAVVSGVRGPSAALRRWYFASGSPTYCKALAHAVTTTMPLGSARPMSSPARISRRRITKG